MDIKINSFARRQTETSPFSHTTLTEAKLLDLVSENFGLAKPCYRKFNPETGRDENGLLYGGVVAISVPPDGFYSGVCILVEGDTLRGAYKARRPGEAPRRNVGVVGGQKIPAKSVEIILYHQSVLAESNEVEEPVSGNTWDIISINASPTEGPTPLHPMTLLANHFGASGGSATNQDAETLLALLKVGYEYWADKSMRAEN